MDDNRKQIIQPVRVLRIVARVEQPELEGEDDSVRELDVAANVFLVLETFEMEGEDVGEGLNLESTNQMNDQNCQACSGLVGLKGHNKKGKDGSWKRRRLGCTFSRLLAVNSSCRSS